MKYLKSILIYFFVCASFFMNAQTETQLTDELKKRGINTMTEVNDALAAHGMTEMEARKMARVYGINYDDYIAKHILGENTIANANLSAGSKSIDKETELMVINESKKLE